MNNEHTNRLKESWESKLLKAQDSKPRYFPKENFVPIILNTGLFYSYVVDFTDYSLYNVDKAIEEIHGVSVQDVTFGKILELIHPDDVNFVAECEQKLIDIFYKERSPLDLLSQKNSYNFRMLTAHGNYELFNHQALCLTLDENQRFQRSLNIHTNINHLAQQPNYTFSIIDLDGSNHLFNEPTSFSVDVSFKLSARELEVIQLSSRGLDNKQIAEHLYLSPETIKKHRRNVLLKTNSNNITELVAKCIRSGLI